LDFWKEKFDKDEYVFNIMEHGYKIPVKMTPAERSQHYRERNNQSARNEMPFVRAEVARLVAYGQVIAMENVPLCCNPLSVAFKVNMDGTIKHRLVNDLSRWVNKFIPASKYLMSKFQDALVMTSPGDFQLVFDISKAYHHLRLAPESYELVGFCVKDKKGIYRFYHFVVVIRTGSSRTVIWQDHAAHPNLLIVKRGQADGVRGRRPEYSTRQGEGRR
jgi:hypothetical protein